MKRFVDYVVGATLAVAFFIAMLDLLLWRPG